jgi:hypothetical protein
VRLARGHAAGVILPVLRKRSRKRATRLPGACDMPHTWSSTSRASRLVAQMRCSRGRAVPSISCAPQKLICLITDRLIQPQLRLTHQEPITGGDGTCGGREDRVDVSRADGAYEGKATDGGIVGYASCLRGAIPTNEAPRVITSSTSVIRWGCARDRGARTVIEA